MNGLKKKFKSFLFPQNRNVKKYEFWKDVIASIEYNYKASAFKGKTLLPVDKSTILQCTCEWLAFWSVIFEINFVSLEFCGESLRRPVEDEPLWLRYLWLDLLFRISFENHTRCFLCKTFDVLLIRVISLPQVMCFGCIDVSKWIVLQVKVKNTQIIMIFRRNSSNIWCITIIPV